MFVTRAGRHDRDELQEFVAQLRGRPPAAGGTAMIARSGAIKGCVRILEVAPNVLVYDDLLVGPDADRALVADLVRAALNNRGGRVFVAVDPTDVSALQELGFRRVGEQELPGEVAAHWRDNPPDPGAVLLVAR